MEKEYLLEYDGKIVKCVIQKAKIKNIYMKVRNSIVEVRIPIRVSYERGIELIDSKRKWIFEALERANNHEDRHIDLKHKEYIYILNKKIKIQYFYTDKVNIKVKLDENHCSIYIPESLKEDNDLIRKVQKKLEQRERALAKIKIDEAMNKYMKLTGLSPVSYSVRKFKSIWGNCSSRKEIKINQNVIWYSQKEIEYVCLHEICHLKYMNHQKRFWNMVEKYMPDYRESVKRFKE